MDERYLVRVMRVPRRRGFGIVVAAVIIGAISASDAPTEDAPASQLPPKAYVWNPAWSQDGREIAFVDTTARGDLWVMNADGGGLRKLTNSQPFSSGSPNYAARQPTWSPDGKTIAFGYGYVGISLIEADGSNLRSFVRGFSFGAEWSPGGKWIAYAAGGELNGTSIWVTSPEGSKKRLVARRPCCSYSYNDPTWSPDGESMAFTVSPAPDTSGNEDSYLAVIDRFRGPVTRLTFGRRYPSSPDWSPDGRKIVFSDWSRRAGTRPLIVALEVRTGATRRLGTGLTPSWSPDGRRIAFSRGGPIWVMRADGSQAHALAPRVG